MLDFLNKGMPKPYRNRRKRTRWLNSVWEEDKRLDCTLKQVRTDMKAALPDNPAKRLKTGYLGDFVEDVRNSQIIKHRTEKSLELSKALVNESVDRNLFKLAFQDGIEVYDYSREDKRGSPFTFKAGK